jgi:hypothetical protein
MPHNMSDSIIQRPQHNVTVLTGVSRNTR